MNDIKNRICILKFQSTYLKRDENGNLVLSENGNYLQETYTSELSNLNDDGKTINPNALRIEFNIYKYFLAAAARAKFSIKNLNKELRYFLTTADFTQVTLYLGYLGSGYNEVFSGEVVTSFTARESRHTSATNITCIQNQGFQTFSYITKTFRKGTTYFELVDYIAKNGSISTNLKLPENLKNYILDTDYVADGNSSSIISKLAQQAGMVYSNDDLEIKEINRVLEEGQEIPYLTSSSGLVGFPILTNSGLQFTSLINPSIKIAQYIKVNNQDISEELEGNPFPNRQLGAWLDGTGIYFVVTLNITGNNKDGDFYYKGNALAKNYIPTMLNTQID